MGAAEKQGRAQAGAPAPCQRVPSAAEQGPGDPPTRDPPTPAPHPGDSFPLCRLQTLVPMQGNSSRGYKERTPGLCSTSICWASTPGPGRSRPRRGTPRGPWEAEGSPGPTLGSGKSSWRRLTSERYREFDLSEVERAAPRLGSGSAKALGRWKTPGGRGAWAASAPLRSTGGQRGDQG